MHSGEGCAVGLSGGLCPTLQPPNLRPVTVRYLIKSPRHLVQYAACNLLPRGYYYYSSFALPEGGDWSAIDAQSLIDHRAYLTKEQRHRQKKGGRGSVRYVRCGRVGYLFSSVPGGQFLSDRPWLDARETPLHVAGHAVRILQGGKVSVRIHREAQRKFQKYLLENVRLPARQLEDLFWDSPFLAFAGVQDNMAFEVRRLNGARRALRLLPVDWRRCVRRRVKIEPVFEETPGDVRDVLAWYVREASPKRKRMCSAEG